MISNFDSGLENKTEDTCCWDWKVLLDYELSQQFVTDEDSVRLLAYFFEILKVSFSQPVMRVTGWPGWVVPRHAVRGRERQSSPRRLLLVSTQYLYKLTARPTFLSWHFSVLYNPLELVLNNLFSNIHWKIMRCIGLCESSETWSSTYLYQHTHLWVNTHPRVFSVGREQGLLVIWGV